MPKTKFKYTARDLWEAALDGLWLATSMLEGDKIRIDLSPTDLKALHLLGSLSEKLSNLEPKFGDLAAEKIEPLAKIYRSLKSRRISTIEATQSIQALFNHESDLTPRRSKKFECLNLTARQISENGGPKAAAVSVLSELYGVSERSLWYRYSKGSSNDQKYRDFSSTESILAAFLNARHSLPQTEAERVGRLIGEYLRDVCKENTSGIYEYIGDLLGQMATNQETRDYFLGSEQEDSDSSDEDAQ